MIAIIPNTTPEIIKGFKKEEKKIEPLSMEPFDDSKIIKKVLHREQLIDWINMNQIETNLLYRGTRDTFKSSQFHSLCDN